MGSVPARQCSVGGCVKRPVAHGLCDMHYRRWKKHGTTAKPERRRPLCSVTGCDRPHAALGLCRKHYERHKRGSDVSQPSRFELTKRERFLAKVDQRDDHECWEWTAARQKRSGYGIFGKQRANRVAYELFVGPIPTGMHVLHTCDNPPCVNPSHLFLGTHEDNMRDMAAKGRSRDSSGDTNPSAKLSKRQVRAIRELASRTTQVELAQRFGVSLDTISRIVRRKSWKNVP